MSDRIRVALVDDHPGFRECVARVLGSQPDIEVVGEGRSSEEALQLARSLSPDLIILDVKMPGGGIDAARAIHESCPAVRMLMLTISEDEDDVRAAFRAGALGYILKGISARDLVRIVRAAHEGICYVAPSLAVG